MHCDMLKIQDGVAIVEKLNYPRLCMHLPTEQYSFMTALFNYSSFKGLLVSSTLPSNMICPLMTLQFVDA